MKIVITGISGFVGPYLQNELEINGHEVFGIDRERSGGNVSAVDLLEEIQVQHYFKKQNFDWVVHLAALTSVKQSWEEPEKFLEINTRIIENIYKSLLEYSNKSKVLLISTSDVYGKQTHFPITEDARPHPQNPYAESKLAQEKVASKFEKISTIITRAFNHPGPGAPEFLAIPNFAKQIAQIENNKRQKLLVGNLESSRDFIDVRDVVRAYRLLIEKGSTGEIYNICSGTERKMNDVLNQLIALSSASIQIQNDPDLMRPSDVPEFWGSHDKITTQTDWLPKIPFEQTLRDILNYWRKNLAR